MEPITHFLTGALISRAGLNRKTAYATVTAVLAAEAADIDIFWGLAGPVEELKHHRGITHTLIGAPVIAGVVVGAVWLWTRWRRPGAGPRPTGEEEQNEFLSQPARWGWLYATALIATLSHLLLDWTNNYGLRPFYPFNSRWYAASIVFIAEPVLWALFFLALAIPWIFALTDQEIGARLKPFRGRGWAVFALAAMVALGCWRFAEQAQARAMLGNINVTAEPVMRMALEPYLVNPYRWHAIFETAGYYQTAEVNTWTGEIQTDAERDVMYKPADTAAVEASKRTELGQVYLDWGKWAVLSDVGQKPEPGLPPPDLPPDRSWTTVEFNDLRFAYSFLSTPGGSRHSPLGGWVYIVDDREEAGEGMGTSPQK